MTLTAVEPDYKILLMTLNAVDPSYDILQKAPNNYIKYNRSQLWH